MAQVHPTCLPSVSRTLTGDSVGLMGQCMEKVKVQKGVGAVAAGTAEGLKTPLFASGACSRTGGTGKLMVKCGLELVGT